MTDPYYRSLGDGRYLATRSTVGPWDARLSHGSPPAALLLHAIDREHPRDDARVAALGFAFLGPVPVAEVSVASEILRPGARVELLRARLSAQGRVAMEATVWRISTASGRAREVPTSAVVPKLPPPQEQRTFGDVAAFGYGESLEWRFVEGAFDQLGPATVFTRPRVPLLEGATHSPLERLLLMVDSANGISAELKPSEWTFVPVELSMSVWRHPRTEWVGMRARTTIDADGIGQTHAELFDEEGFVGTALQTLFVAPR